MWALSMPRQAGEFTLGEVVHSDFELDADAFMQAFGVESMLRSAA